MGKADSCSGAGATGASGQSPFGLPPTARQACAPREVQAVGGLAPLPVASRQGHTPVKRSRPPIALSVRRLGAADEGILALLAREDADFDVAGRGSPRAPLSLEGAQAYLADTSVLHFIAELEQQVVGHLQCILLRKRAAPALEVLLYEIGVRTTHRRQGVGRALVDALEGWMKAHQLRELWVLADNPGAVAFYRACGFQPGVPPPIYLMRL